MQIRSQRRPNYLNLDHYRQEHSTTSKGPYFCIILPRTNTSSRIIQGIARGTRIATPQTTKGTAKEGSRTRPTKEEETSIEIPSSTLRMSTLPRRIRQQKCTISAPKALQNLPINLPINLSIKLSTPIILFNPITLPLSFNSIINFIYVICVINSID
jgi:hypothetical protein